jgi:hypothetical protein
VTKFANCPYCGRPANADGGIHHEGGCIGLEDAGLIKLQHYALDQRIRELEAASAKLIAAWKDNWRVAGWMLEMKAFEAAVSTVDADSNG